MSASTINIHINDPAKPQRSYSLGEAREICRLDARAYWERAHGKFADFWRADNRTAADTAAPAETGVRRRGRKKGFISPRFHAEHVDYMVAVINGLMPEAEAQDLWNLRRKAIPDELRRKALEPMMTTKRRRA